MIWLKNMEGEAIKFSVLMSVYNKENPAYLERAIKSIWDDQILKPAEIIIVEDGPLSNGILFVLDKWDKRLKDKFRRVQLEVNSGLGPALRAGLLKCKYNIVARMDSDDISLPNRFNLQLNLINKKGIGIVGCWVEEFDENNKVIGTRKTPQNHEDIYNFSRFRNPMNHPSVIFKKNLVIVTGVGGGSGKMAFCLSQIYHENKKRIKSGFAKFETFPIWNLKMDHPVNIAYEAATADLGDYNMVDKSHKGYAVNYNRDVDNFKILKSVMKKFNRDLEYDSPTDMGVNMAKKGIIDDKVCREAAKKEIVRRYKVYSNEFKKGREKRKTLVRMREIIQKI